MTAIQPRRAKIVCTIGPATKNETAIAELISSGMNVARLNFSHGTHAEHQEVFRLLRQEAARQDVSVGILGDLQGPKIRVGKIPDPGIILITGEPFVLSVNPHETVTEHCVTIDYPYLAKEVQAGERILLDDGTLELRVTSVDGDRISTVVVIGGLLSSRKGVNLPGIKLAFLPSITAKDQEDLKFALEIGVDMIALSFVRSAEDVLKLRSMMDEQGRRVPIIAKIEKPTAVTNLESILDAADGIMVARGDLGVEMGPEEVPLIQKGAIDMANARGKVVITATQMLDSMIRNPRPTRAEASDVANAVLDGSDALMLSGETTTGAHPIRSVQIMNKIICSTERSERYWREPPIDLQLGHTTNTIARAAVACSNSLQDTRAIITYTGSGGIARLVSGYRPKVPIFALTPQESTYHSLSIYWGVVPVRFSPSRSDGQGIFMDIDKAILAHGYLQMGDRIVIALGFPLMDFKSVNLLKLHKVGESLPKDETA